MNDTALRARQGADLQAHGAFALAEKLSVRYADRLTGWLRLPALARTAPRSELMRPAT